MLPRLATALTLGCAVTEGFVHTALPRNYLTHVRATPSANFDFGESDHHEGPDSAKDVLRRWTEGRDHLEATANGYLASITDPYTRVERLWLQSALDRLLSVLTVREQTILRLRYGLAQPGLEQTPAPRNIEVNQHTAIPFTVELRPRVEVSKQLGISKSEIHKFETRALQKLRSPKCVAALRGYVSCVREVVVEAKHKSRPSPQYRGFMHGSRASYRKDGVDYNEEPWFEGHEDGVFEFKWPDDDVDI